MNKIERPWSMSGADSASEPGTLPATKAQPIPCRVSFILEFPPGSGAGFIDAIQKKRVDVYGAEEPADW